MPSEYSFLDVAVLDAVRQHFAAGDAIAILSVDLEHVIWANGPGAATFGYPDIEAIIGASAQLPLVARRQIMATSGFPEIGSDRGVTVRLATGMSSRTVGFLASSMTLPDGEKAIMLVVPATQTGSRSAAEIAGRAISGFSEDGHFIAFIDGGGSIEAASEGFAALGIQQATLTALAADMAAGGESIVKRLVPGGGVSYPAGLARLTPERHLLVVIDEDRLDARETLDSASDTSDAAGRTEAPSSNDAPALSPPDEPKLPALYNSNSLETETAANDGRTVEIADGFAPDPVDRFAEAVEQERLAPVAPAFAATAEHQEAATGTNGPTEQTPATVDSDRPQVAATPAQHDHWYFNAGEDDRRPSPPPVRREMEAPAEIRDNAARSAGQQERHSPVLPADAPVRRTIDREAASLRFVWRTDAEGRFSALSPEFGDVVGKQAADVIGRRFQDVATTFGLDASGEIAGLLERRDTWSGRSVLWPVVGTDLKIPVDLAALPIYGRSRAFEGFRGFGVARTGDAVVDPEAIGMALIPNSEAPLGPEPETGAASSGQAAIEPIETDQPNFEEPKGEAPKEQPEPGNDGRPRPADPFNGEVPALTIVPKPERRFADKVIRLAEHRQPANDKGLSTLERSAFREIGERLKKDSAPAEAPEAGLRDVETHAPTNETAGPVPEPSAAGAEIAALPEEEASRSSAGGTISNPGNAELPLTRPESQAVAEPSSTEGEADQRDLARLDEIAPQHAEPDHPARSHSSARDSLPDDAGQSENAGPEADIDDASALSEPAPAEPDTGRPLPSEELSPALAREADVDDDSMTSADFRDAEDSEDWAEDREERAADDSEEDAPRNRQAAVHDDAISPVSDAAEEGHEGGETDSDADLLEGRKTVAPAEPATRPAAAIDTVSPVHLSRPPMPPLKREGFMPSAFYVSAAGEAPDTSLLGRLPVPLLIHSGDRLHYANEEFLRLTEYETVEELTEAGGLGALFADRYGDDSTSESTDRALRLKTRGQEEFPIEAILRSVPWGDGKALMLVVRRSGEAERITSPAIADEQTQPDMSELKARIAEMRTIIDTATDGVVLIGRDGAIRSISRPAEALFGFDSDEVTGKPFASLFAIESQRAARDYLNGLSEPGVASVMNDGREVIGREAQGRFIPLFMTIGRLPNDSGFCAVVRDITQWKRAEEDLTQARAVAERASSQKTDFLARISHEIRTPLNAIIGFSELMVDEKFGPVANDRYRDYLRDINRSGNHVLDLVNDLLDISKIEAGQQEMAYEAVSLNDTLAETVAMMQPQANRERVIIRSSFASRLPEVVADLRSVRQIALNILSNAIRYTQAGGQVIVSTAYEPSGDVVMRVRDTGIGMSQAEIEQALKPFKQISALRRGRGDGTGLGLPLTKAMVEANRARFIINSTPGEGTLVEVAFPSTRVLAE
jgi:PAS domain S-box-containing protein